MKRHHLAALALFLTAAAWGASFTLVKNVLNRIAPEPYIFYRFTLAGVILLVLALSRLHDVGPFVVVRPSNPASFRRARNSSSFTLPV